MSDALHVLCTADLHLGRHPTRIPDEVDGPDYSPTTVWHATVRAAIDRDVDLVVVAGDVVDAANQYFEAFGPFEAGVTTLADAGIPVVAVAGNHDHDALPQLVDAIDAPTLHLLGRGGAWERVVVERDGSEAADGSQDGQPTDDEPLAVVDGWSFPTEHVYESPMATYGEALEAAPDVTPVPDGVPHVGVCHGDLDERDSDYAPIDAHALRESAPSTWVLGHVHAPGVRIDDETLALYPGSPQPLDPGEPGAHGPWLLSLPDRQSPGGTRSTAEQWPLASVRYDDLDVDVSAAADPEAATGTITDHLRDHVADHVVGAGDPLCLLALTLTGRTDAHGGLAERRASLRDDLALRVDGVHVRVASVDVATRPAIDLADLADGEDAAAHLAALLLAIDAGEATTEYPALVEDARTALRTAHDANSYAPLRRETDLEPPDEAMAVDALEREASRLLDRLVGQSAERGERGDPGEGPA